MIGPDGAEKCVVFRAFGVQGLGCRFYGLGFQGSRLRG